MSSHLHKAYTLGSQQAQADFEKVARGEMVTPILGAMHPLAAGIAGGVTAPDGDRWATGLASGGGSLLGTTAGGLLGAGAGAAGGYGVHRLADLLGEDIDPETATSLGALIGGIGGGLGGGAYGAHLGRRLVADKDEPQKR